MLSATSEYALRAVVGLAQLPEGEMIGGQELAESYQIPACYLSKILQTLRDAGIVEAVRGVHGGYRLLKPAANVHVVDVVGLFEGEQAEPRCLLGEGYCSDEVGCSAHARYRKVRKAYVDFLETTTIKQIAKKKSDKKKT